VRHHWRDRTWRLLGKTDPYYAVLTNSGYRRDNFDQAARDEFFASGERHAQWVLRQAKRVAGPDFTPRRVMDFGCGVGRVLIPLARSAVSTLGVDVSTDMLAEARANVQRAGIQGVDLVSSDDALSMVEGQFDLVHAYIVFQHIAPRRGERIVAGLLERVAPGGVVALHFTCGRDAPAWRRVLSLARRSVPGVNAIVNLARHRPISEPVIPMFEYRLERVIHLYRDRGCAGVWAIITDHGGHPGVMLVACAP
jgi:SAM-dependent methyltransferase